MPPEKTAQERADYATRFKPGNPGRPKGAKQKLATDFVRDLAEEWEKRGAEALTQLTAKELVDAVGKLLPKELHITNDDDLSEAELLARLAEIDAVLGPVARAVGTKIEASRATGSEKLN